MPVRAQELWDALKARHYAFVAGVPDSTFGSLYSIAAGDPEVHYVPAVREDIALGLASAGYLAGRRAAVLMQNSGLGNCLNALTSFSLIYKVPATLVVGWRGSDAPPSDAPEHHIMGAKTIEILEVLGLPYAILEAEPLEDILDRLILSIEERSVPGVLLVRPGVIQ